MTRSRTIKIAFCLLLLAGLGGWTFFGNQVASVANQLATDGRHVVTAVHPPPPPPVLENSPGESWALDEVSVGQVFELGLPYTMAKPYQWVVLRDFTLGSSLQPHVTLLRKRVFGPKQAFIQMRGWPLTPRRYYPNWPIAGHRPEVEQGWSGGTLVMAFKATHPGLYKFENATVTGVGYRWQAHTLLKVPFSQTFTWHWGYCVGHSIKYCAHHMTDKWIAS